jgi:hypothetical protein
MAGELSRLKEGDRMESGMAGPDSSEMLSG